MSTGRKSSLKSVGIHVVMEILEKMTPKTACRFRSTCAWIDELAEVADKKPVAELHVFADHAKIRMVKENDNTSRNQKTRDTKMRTLDRETSIVDQLSGFFVKELILVKYPNPQIEADLISLFRHRKNSLSVRVCDNFKTDYATKGPPVAPQLIIDLRPELVTGNFCLKALDLMSKIRTIATNMGRPAPVCWSLLKDFPRVELHWPNDDNHAGILLALLKDWQEGLDMGKCQFVSVCFHSDGREHDVIAGKMNLEFAVKATLHDVNVYNKPLSLIRNFALRHHRTSDLPVWKMKFNVNAYQLRKRNGETAAVLMNEPEKQELFYFAFIRKGISTLN